MAEKTNGEFDWLRIGFRRIAAMPPRHQLPHSWELCYGTGAPPRGRYPARSFPSVCRPRRLWNPSAPDERPSRQENHATVFGSGPQSGPTP